MSGAEGAGPYVMYQDYPWLRRRLWNHPDVDEIHGNIQGEYRHVHVGIDPSCAESQELGQNAHSHDDQHGLYARQGA